MYEFIHWAKSWIPFCKGMTRTTFFSEIAIHKNYIPSLNLSSTFKI